MKKSYLVASAAVMSLLTSSAMAANHGDLPGKEKCYGIAKAGSNDCSAADGSHGCAGKAAADGSPYEWKMVDGGTCVTSGGRLTPIDGAPHEGEEPAPAAPVGETH